MTDPHIRRNRTAWLAVLVVFLSVVATIIGLIALAVQQHPEPTPSYPTGQLPTI